MANKNPSPNTRWKKGQTGNPEGGRAHDPVTKALRKLTLPIYREVIELVMTGNLNDLKAMVEDPATPAVQVGIATSLLKAIKAGDYIIIERIAERIIGKIPDELNVRSNNTNVELVLDKEKLKKAIADLEADV